MARVISGKLRLDVKPVAIESLVTAAIEVVEPAAAAKKIAIRTEFEPDLPPSTPTPIACSRRSGT